MAEQIIRPRNFTDTATDSDLQNADNYLWLDTANKAKKVEVTRLAVVGDTAATESDLVAGSKLPIMTAAGPKALPGNAITPKTYAQNVATSIAPPFDPTKPNDAGGYAYYAGEIVSNNGATYRFKVNHSSGAWNAAEVDRYVTAQTLQLFVVTDNPEYLYAVMDKDGVFLFGSKKDGSFEWTKGLPHFLKKIIDAKVDSESGKSLINSIFANGVKVESNDDYDIWFESDNGVFLFGVKKDGSFEWQKGIPTPVRKGILVALETKVDKENGKALIDSVFAAAQFSGENSEYVRVVMDNDGRIIYGIKSDSSFVVFSKAEFKKLILRDENVSDFENFTRKYGIAERYGDLSNLSSASIPIPHLAFADFSNIAAMPSTKQDNYKGILKFRGDGVSFEKKVIMNAQGNSSLTFPKKNIAIDLCNDDWEGDDTFKIAFGDWVPQDSFHIKAYYHDFFRGQAVVGYDVFSDIVADRDFGCDAPWKIALVNPRDYTTGKGLAYGASEDLSLRLDTGAKNHPDGFPVIVTLNGDFYGIFVWQLKKHRDNYHMNKSEKTEIHLDGVINSDTFFGGTIDWTEFEVRNPKSLVVMDGSSYDGDNPQELMGDDSPSYDSSNKKHKTSAYVKTKVEEFADSISYLTNVKDLHGYNSPEFKTAFEEIFDVDNLIDYSIFCDVIYNIDGSGLNWQWTTYDGKKWFVNPYDLDRTFGSFDGVIFDTTASHLTDKAYSPTRFLYRVDEYNAAVQSRYAELRSKGIVSAKRISEMMNSWTKRVGFKFYEKEFERWPGDSCDRDMIVDDNWKLVLVDGEPVFGESSTYSGTQNYQVGDEVFYGIRLVTGYYKFVCKNPCSGVAPIFRQGVRDSIWRFASWMTEYISNLDVIYNYNQGE